MAFLPRQICPHCSFDEYAEQLEAPGLWRLTCTSNPSLPDPYTWLTTGKGAFDHTVQDGMAAQMGIYEDLLDIVNEASRWIEWGIVEYLYALAQPTIYKNLVAEYGHVSLGPKQYTASSFIGAALGHVRREGGVVSRPCDATGRFAYLRRVHVHASLPEPPLEATQSWSDFAIAEGFSPMDWPPLMDHPDYVPTGDE